MWKRLFQIKRDYIICYVIRNAHKTRFFGHCSTSGYASQFKSPNNLAATLAQSMSLIEGDCIIITSVCRV